MTNLSDVHIVSLASKPILTAQSDGGGNYHCSYRPFYHPQGDRRAGMNSTLGVIISTTIRLQSSQYLFYIPHMDLFPRFWTLKNSL